ncbi:shootin-1-like [Helianthus annuus]|uniref:shootin-1-like n=1 Tax=Helianthus annuus TaxID=4232 RepID=UPI000B8FD8BD|nr:shootin-1-like [Helianthus annuus]
MRPRSAAGSWKSDFDVPILSESMMLLITEDSPYRAEYLRMLSRQAETKEGLENVSPMKHDAEESSTPRMEQQDESDPHPADEDVHMSLAAEEHHAEGSHMGETGAEKSKLNIFYNSESHSDEPIQGKYEILHISTVSTKQNVSETKDPFFESDSAEENVVAIGGDQSTDQANLDEKNTRHQTMSPKQLHKELEDIFATEKTATEEKLDLILKEIRNQKSEIKVLSETVKTVQKQTEENNAALKTIQKSVENKESSLEIEKALKELRDINKKMTEVATTGESSSSGKILEEIHFLRANNSNMTEAFEKLLMELTAQRNKESQEFQKMKKQEETNTQALTNIHLLVKRLQYNVATLAKVDLHKLKAPIPQERQATGSETLQHQQEAIQQEQTKQTKTSTTQKQKQTMGPPPDKQKLPMGPPPNVPKSDTSKIQLKEHIPVQPSSTTITGET